MEQSCICAEIPADLTFTLLDIKPDKVLKRLEKSVLEIMSLLGDQVEEKKLVDALKREVHKAFVRASRQFEDHADSTADKTNNCVKIQEYIDAGSSTSTPNSCLETSPVHSALFNELIISNIFQYLPFNSLKSCREVCPSWKDVGTKELSKRSCQVTLWDMKDDPDCRVGSRDSATTLQQFLLHLRKSDSVPFSHLQVQSDSMYKLAVPFFGSHGNLNFQSLSITGLKSGATLSFILKKCTQIKSLKLDLSQFKNFSGSYQFFRSQGDGPFRPQVYFPHLLYLEVIPIHRDFNAWGALSVLNTLILASPNLVELQNFNIRLITAVVQTKRIDLIKSLMFKPIRNDDMRFYIILINHRPRLEQLTLECTTMKKSPIVMEVMRKLLQSSRQSLITLRTDPLGRLINQAIEGPFENLENMTIHNRNMSSSLLPGGIGFPSRMFPQLRSVRFEIKVKSPSVHKLFAHNPADDIREDLQNESIPTVTNIELMNHLDKAGLQMLLRKFPNITKMTLKNTQYPVKPSGDRIWEFLPASISTLELFDSSFHFHNEKNFDYVFTGIPLLRCKKILESEGEMRANDLKRNKPWIGHLENLRKLRLTLHQEESYLGHKEWTLSSVTAEHAFRKMAHLQVTIVYDQHHLLSAELEKKLEPLEPFVTFEHEPLSPF